MNRQDYGFGSMEERSPGSWRVIIELQRDPITGRPRRSRFTVRGTKRVAEEAPSDTLTKRDHGGSDQNRITTAFLRRSETEDDGA